MATPLYIRTGYSLLSSMCHIDGIISKCLQYGYKAMAIVDQSVLFGAASFKKACDAKGIKALFGLEVKVKIKEAYYNIVIYAKDDEGYLNLMHLSSYINCEHQDIDVATLNKYRGHNILVLLSDDCPLSNCDIEKNGKKIITELKNEFQDFLMGIMDNNVYGNKERNNALKPLLKSMNIKTIALSRTFYLNSEDALDYEVLKCIRDKRVYDENTPLEYGRYFLNQDEYSAFYDVDDILNSDVLANICNVNFDFKSTLPSYPCPNNVDSKQYLTLLAKEGLKRRLKNKITKDYISRLEYELEVILKMHFEDYFLIVYDYILYAKKHGIYVGPARGSAAGCLVCYCLGITEIDPLKYNLLFERFLNPERISLPDIDTDFPDDRRDEVFNYVLNKYGQNHVAHIITYGTLKARQVIRDVGKVLKYTTYEIDQIAKLISQDVNATLKNTYETSALFRQRIDYDQRSRNLYEISLKLEGMPRHISTHAAGVVFSKKNLGDVIPLIKIEEDIYSSQYSMEHLEKMGLIKMDFLGLRNLSIIDEIVNDIKKVDPLFDLKNISLQDTKTFALISRGDNLGVFQLESSGMVNLSKKMKPNCFTELSMMLALFRPGPMENIDSFLYNRANKSLIKYPNKAIKPILEETYGIILYQEQIMAIARIMANFSYGKADLLRKAMSKKKLNELESLSKDFIDGCINNGYSLKEANDIYNLILKFANYGFNKSHSIAYGLLAYQMAYLKANYPLYFYKAVLNGVMGSSIKTSEYIKECQKRDITVLKISLNNSYDTYKIVNNSLLMPFTVVKDVGRQSCQKIIEEREKGSFKDVVYTIVRLVKVGIDARVLENLISSGAFDEFGYSRYSLSDSLENILKYAQTKSSNFVSIIDDRPIIKKMADNKMVLAQKENEVLGFYFTYNPISDYKKEKNIVCPNLKEISQFLGSVSGFGLIKRIKEIKTKKTKEKMAFIDIIDESYGLSLTVFPDVYKLYEGKLKENTYIIFEGKRQNQDDLIVRKIKEV